MQQYPALGPRSFLDDDLIQRIKVFKCKGDESACRHYITAELDSIAGSVDDQAVHEPLSENQWLARVYDAYLYAQDDKYTKPGESEDDGFPTKPLMATE